MSRHRFHIAPLKRLCLAGLIALQMVLPVKALDGLSFSVASDDKRLTRALREASILVQSRPDATSDPLDLYSAARADYQRLLSALYAQGYYGSTIHILIDGKEAADLSPIDAPARILQIQIAIDPGPRFTFGQARMKPYAPGTHLPPAYRDGKLAQATAIQDAARAGIDGWRQLGHAKAMVVGQSITADHESHKLDAEILLDAGPKLRFGDLHLTGNERMRANRILRISGFRSGQEFDPDSLTRMVDRLRRTGIFRTVALNELAEPNPDGSLDLTLDVAEELPHRFGFGAQVSSADGADLSAFWLHRNLLGGGERLRLDGVVRALGSDNDVTSYELGARLDRPATPTTDSSAFLSARYRQTDWFGFDLRSLDLGFGLTRTFSDQFVAEAGLSYQNSTLDGFGQSQRFQTFSLPVELKFDRRNDDLLPTKGSYLKLSATPFWGFGATGSGAQLKADARFYHGFGAEDRLVLAGRLQAGTVTGTSLSVTPPDYLFFSGGGGTVRGHPYQSLGVTSGGSAHTGGLSFLGLSAEVRRTLNDKLGAALFYDAGYVSDASFFGGTSAWQSGIGIGLRYDTIVGPVRLDIATPLSGTTGDGVQVYVGIGQAF
ncbi:MAG: BamA/TamA family outer membrane protein [Rhodobacteraceae bacterium]|nr:BamA/TamA family outer membrane protein [Paracoccaceae bacterium]